MKLKTILRSALFSIALLTPSLAFAEFFVLVPDVGCDNYVCWLGDFVLYTINDVLVPVLFSIAFVVFLYGIAKSYILNSGEPAEVQKGHKLMLWGIIAFAIMISIWGLVNVVANTFGLSGYYAPELPTSY